MRDTPRHFYACADLTPFLLDALFPSESSSSLSPSASSTPDRWIKRSYEYVGVALRTLFVQTCQMCTGHSGVLGAHGA